MDLLLDIKTVIAAYDQEVWYLLYRHDQEFHDYAVTGRAISRFVELFTVKTVKLHSTKYRLFGRLHRCGLPAVIRANGAQAWYQRGLCHRGNDLPAVTTVYGYKAWFLNGRRHRDNDRPAMVSSRGDQQWYQHGELHRDNDLPALIHMNGDREWYQHGKFYRNNDSPAIRTGT
jgi:hypothetical protein